MFFSRANPQRQGNLNLYSRREAVVASITDMDYGCGGILSATLIEQSKKKIRRRSHRGDNLPLSKVFEVI